MKAIELILNNFELTCHLHKLQLLVANGRRNGYCSQSYALCIPDIRCSSSCLWSTTISRWPVGSLGISTATPFDWGMLYARVNVPIDNDSKVLKVYGSRKFICALKIFDKFMVSSQQPLKIQKDVPLVDELFYTFQFGFHHSKNIFEDTKRVCVGRATGNQSGDTPCILNYTFQP